MSETELPASADAAGNEVFTALETPSAPEQRRGMSGARNPVTAMLTLRDLLVVTYAVPAELVRSHVPESLALDMLPSLEGERLAFIQTTCAFHENARWSLMPEKMGGGQSFHQITYRVLTRREGRRGAFAVRTYVSTDEGRAAQRAISRDADFARFTLYIAGDPARATYDSYTLRAQGDLGKTQIEAKSAAAPPADSATLPSTPFPFGSLDELSTFLVDRPDNYFRASAPKAGIGLLPQEYGVLPTPTRLELTTAPRLTLWTNWGVFSADNPPAPYAALLFPAVTVTSHPPRFAKLNAPAAVAGAPADGGEVAVE